MMKRLILFFTLVAVLLALPLAAAARDVYPEVIPLETGFAPEGITAGVGHTFYYGALNGGAIFRGDYRSGEYEPLVDPDPSRIAVGMSHDRRSNHLYVAGGFAGTAYVYDGGDGIEVAVIQLAAPFVSWINDATVTEDAVYFTDSFQAVFYRVPLGDEGMLPDPPQVETIPLGGDFVNLPQAPPDFVVNSNGIVATPDSSWLVIVNTAVGALYRVDPLTGYATEIDLGEEVDVLMGDGLVLRGHTLYVVQNFLNQIRVIELDPDFATGRYIQDLTSDAFRVPTTAAIFGNALYAVNARFDEIDPFDVPADAEFEAVRVEIN
jgi:sugar lactone lactonase YvrE